MNRKELEKKVKHTVHVLVYEKGYASMLDLLVRMEKVTQKLVEEWRFRRVPYLERVVQGGLGRLNFILDVYHRTAKEMNLKPSITVYKSYGKGKKIPLQFSKFGHPHVERLYSTHYVKPVEKEQKKDTTTAEKERRNRNVSRDEKKYKVVLPGHVAGFFLSSPRGKRMILKRLRKATQNKYSVTNCCHNCLVS